jgi:hypothetical protein
VKQLVDSLVGDAHDAPDVSQRHALVVEGAGGGLRCLLCGCGGLLGGVAGFGGHGEGGLAVVVEDHLEVDVNVVFGHFEQQRDDLACHGFGLVEPAGLGGRAGDVGRDDCPPLVGAFGGEPVGGHHSAFLGSFGGAGDDRAGGGLGYLVVARDDNVAAVDPVDGVATALPVKDKVMTVGAGDLAALLDEVLPLHKPKSTNTRRSRQGDIDTIGGWG